MKSEQIFYMRHPKMGMAHVFLWLPIVARLHLGSQDCSVLLSICTVAFLSSGRARAPPYCIVTEQCIFQYLDVLASQSIWKAPLIRRTALAGYLTL
jgi:hypothetical protein